MDINNKWVIPQQKKTIIVGVAEMIVSNDATADLVTYSLGSCLGISLYDPVLKLGGLLHVMLPSSRLDPSKAARSPNMFVDTGVPRLFHALYDLGADRSRMVMKAFGGAQFLDSAGIFNIGERNKKALLHLVSQNCFTIHAQDFGGISSRTLRLSMADGSVQIQSPGVNPYTL
jgi:chemotaxis protein CheD